MKFRHAYDIGTEVQEKSGRVKKKIEDLDGAKWIGRNRFNYMMHHKRELEENEKVYHVNGDKADDRPENLVAIKFSGVRYELRTSKVVWSPRPILRAKGKLEVVGPR